MTLEQGLQCKDDGIQWHLHEYAGTEACTERLFVPKLAITGHRNFFRFQPPVLAMRRSRLGIGIVGMS